MEKSLERGTVLESIPPALGVPDHLERLSMTDLQLFHNTLPTNPKNPDIPLYNAETAAAVRAFHRTMPDYAPTPLAHLPMLAKELGVKDVFVKDEGKRFGLKAFKALGGSWCIATLLAEELGMERPDFTVLTAPETLKRLGNHTFSTATDGNHGMGVAWTAMKLGQKAVIYMPKGSSVERVERIRRTGATVHVTDVNYDATVELAKVTAEKNGWTYVQDTDRPGYTDIPKRLMAGYMTMAQEAIEEMREKGVRPTHVFLQAGVGSMAAGVAAYLTNVFRDRPPVFVIVEAEAADCLHKTVAAQDGKIHIAEGDLATMMAGLACGEPCRTALSMLEDLAENFVTITDRVSARAMRMLGNPLPGDDRVVSGESGASGFGAFVELVREGSPEAWRKTVGLDENAVVLCFSTEADTDRENYRRVVWEGVPSSDPGDGGKMSPDGN